MSGLRGRFEVYWAPGCGSIHLSWAQGIELEPVGGPDVQKRLIVTPFMPTHDLFRGILYAAHALFSYSLMLTAMSSL